MAKNNENPKIVISPLNKSRLDRLLERKGETYDNILTRILDFCKFKKMKGGIK